MDENRSDLFGISETEKRENPVNASVSEQESENTEQAVETVQNKTEEKTVYAEPVKTAQQKVESFYKAADPVANGCTYSYARPQQPQVQAERPQVAYTSPVQQPQPQPARPQATSYAPPVQNANASYNTQRPQYSYYNAPQSQSENMTSSFRKEEPVVTANKKEKKKDKKEKKPKNRMSFGQLFLCLALCLVVGSISGYVSSKTAVENALDAFKETLTTAATTGSYNINIFEQQTETTTPTQSAQDEPTVPVATNATASEIYKKNVNAVVNITAKGVRTVNFGFFFGSQQQEFTSSGSGFFLTEDGYILTNYHVVEGATTFVATDFDGNEHTAKLVGYEESNDIAVLKVSGTFQAVELGNSKSLEVGDTLLIIGNALGELQYTLTQGVVSYLERAVTTETGSVINMFQTDAAINSGNSGGPVFNAKGEVVGIASAKYASSTIEGLGFCIPVDDVKYMISDIVNVGYVTGKPAVGVSLYTNTSRSNGLPYGCYVVAVAADSTADNAGIDEGDVITAVDGKNVRDVDDFGSALSGKRAGDSITLTVYFASSGSSSQVTLTLDEYIPHEPRTDYTNVYDY